MNRPWLALVLVVILAIAAGVVLAGVPDDAGSNGFSDPAATYDPIVAGEALPDGYRIGLGRDAIAPVYEPSFTDAAGVDWPGDSLVIGIAGEEVAKAYPVTHLNSREMVVDSLEGIPILVTW